MKSKLLHILAIILILEVGLVHYFTAQHEFEEAALLGYLFMANFLGALLAAYGIYRRQAWGWWLGLGIALGSLVGYVWSRTAGLPGLEVEAWISPWGGMSLISEALFSLLAVLHLRRPAPVEVAETPAATSRRMGRYLLPAAGLALLSLLNVTTFRLETLFPEEEHAHVFSLSEVRRQPVLSQAEFEQRYGLQLSLVAVSSMDSIVDVRLKILDLDKAATLLDEHSALLVGNTLILAPHQHRHVLKEGKAFIAFYPNLKGSVASGTPVSLVFENMRLEPILAR
jgi:hypothetical protein